MQLEVKEVHMGMRMFSGSGECAAGRTGETLGLSIIDIGTPRCEDDAPSRIMLAFSEDPGAW